MRSKKCTKFAGNMHRKSGFSKVHCTCVPESTQISCKMHSLRWFLPKSHFRQNCGVLQISKNRRFCAAAESWFSLGTVARYQYRSMCEARSISEDRRLVHARNTKGVALVADTSQMALACRNGRILWDENETLTRTLNSFRFPFVHKSPNLPTISYHTTHRGLPHNYSSTPALISILPTYINEWRATTRSKKICHWLLVGNPAFFWWLLYW